MHASEIRACDLCGRGLCVDGHVRFTRIGFQRFAIDPIGWHSKSTMEALYAGMKLPDLVPPAEPPVEVATLVDEPADLIVCETCGCGHEVLLTELAVQAGTMLKARIAAVQSTDNGDQTNDCENQD